MGPWWNKLKIKTKSVVTGVSHRALSEEPGSRVLSLRDGPLDHYPDDPLTPTPAYPSRDRSHKVDGPRRTHKPNASTSSSSSAGSTGSTDSNTTVTLATAYDSPPSDDDEPFSPDHLLREFPLPPRVAVFTQHDGFGHERQYSSSDVPMDMRSPKAVCTFTADDLLPPTRPVTPSPPSPPLHPASHRPKQQLRPSTPVHVPPEKRMARYYASMDALRPRAQSVYAHRIPSLSPHLVIFPSRPETHVQSSVPPPSSSSSSSSSSSPPRPRTGVGRQRTHRYRSPSVVSFSQPTSAAYAGVVPIPEPLSRSHTFPLSNHKQQQQLVPRQLPIGPTAAVPLRASVHPRSQRQQRAPIMSSSISSTTSSSSLSSSSSTTSSRLSQVSRKSRASVAHTGTTPRASLPNVRPDTPLTPGRVVVHGSRHFIARPVRLDALRRPVLTHRGTASSASVPAASGRTSGQEVLLRQKQRSQSVSHVEAPLGDRGHLRTLPPPLTAPPVDAQENWDDFEALIASYV